MVAPKVPISSSGKCAFGLVHGIQRQRHQGHDPALAAVVGTQHEADVLQRHDQGQAPENQGNDAQQVGLVECQPVGGIEDSFEGIEGAGADIAVDNANGGQRQRSYAAFLML
jgi:hypothetical protein